jgi:uncharacterized protein (TIGR03643 family)
MKQLNVTSLSPESIDRIIEMAWEDRTPFDAIHAQFGISESEVKRIMRAQLLPKNYAKWRERVEACKTKHAKTRSTEISRFKSSRQRAISSNRISKSK